MISTISMRLEQPRHPKPIRTQRRASGTTGVIIAIVLGAMLVCFVFFGQRLVHAAPQETAKPLVATPAAASVPVPVPGTSNVAELRAAVTTLPTFPDAYPVAAGVSP